MLQLLERLDKDLSQATRESPIQICGEMSENVLDCDGRIVFLDFAVVFRRNVFGSELREKESVRVLGSRGCIPQSQ